MSVHSRYVLLGGSLLVALSMTGCHQKSDDSASTPAHSATVASATSAKPAPSAAQPLRTNPDFGGVTTQHVEVTATGTTLENAVDNAIRLAIEQVNGKKIDAGSLQMNAGMTVAADGQGVDVTSSAYANWVASVTSGAVSHFQLISQKQVNVPTRTDEESLKASQGASWNKGSVDASANASAAAGDASASTSEGVKGNWDQHQGATQVDYQSKHTDYASRWEVRIGADVATYREAASAKLTRVVVALPQVSTQTYQVGDNAIPSEGIASAIQAKVSEALTQTHRFTVLDRTANAQIDQEIGLIQSGNATAADTARLGQQLAADLIVIPTVNRFEYVRHEQPLRLANRTLVSYSGGGEVSFRVVNAATGQMVMSQSFKYDFPSTSPTTLGISVDGNTLASNMMDAVDRNIVASILQSTYPLSVLQVQGRNVVINQGGEAVQDGATYQAVSLGKPVVDPQSGQSLGPTETPCCSITIDRVTPNLSYGHIVEDNVQLGNPYTPGSLELRGQLALSTPPTGSSPAKAMHSSRAKQAQASKAAASTGDSNW
ncbi:CsgG/HfaB family protein [Dyella psychrodurans]|nr:CsgG/HfaB family protein [Dyella psychrodurans]